MMSKLFLTEFLISILRTPISISLKINILQAVM